MKRFLVILCAFMLMVGGALAEDRQDEAHRYSDVGPVSEGFTWATAWDGVEKKYLSDREGTYIIDVHGNRLTDETYTVTNQYFSNGLVTVYKDGKAGCIDRSGNVVIPFEFFEIYGFNDVGHALAALGKDWGSVRWGVIDRQGQWLVPAEWDNVMVRVPSWDDETISIPDEEKERLAIVWKDGLAGILNMNGETVLPCEYVIRTMDSFHEGRLPVKKEGVGYGYVNEHGEIVIPCRWTYGSVFSEGLARVLDGMKSGYIDPDGNLVIFLPEGWNARGDFRDGMALVENDQGLYGYIDQTGALVIPFQWEKADAFSEGIAQVWQDGKCGFIDQTGALVIPCQWKRAQKAQDGHIIVQDENGLWGVMDLAGNLTVPCVYSSIERLADQVYIMMNEIGGRDLYGLIGADGTVICPCMYSLISHVQFDGFVQVCLGYTRMADYDAWNGQESTTGFISLTGELIVPCEYDHGYYRNGYFTLIKDGYLTILDRDGNLVF